MVEVNKNGRPSDAQRILFLGLPVSHTGVDLPPKLPSHAGI